MSVMLTGRPRTELLTCRDVVEAGRHPYTGRLGVLGERDDAAVASLHEVDLAQKAADHVICIKDGRVAFQGSPGEVLYGHYPSVYIAWMQSLGTLPEDPAR